MGKICLKCNHERSFQDDPNIPESTCPRCGAVYVKVEAAKKINSNVKSHLLDEDKIREIKGRVLFENQKRAEKTLIENDERTSNIIQQRFNTFLGSWSETKKGKA